MRYVLTLGAVREFWNQWDEWRNLESHDRTADRTMQIMWNNWVKPEVDPEPALAVVTEPSPVRRLLWQAGTWLVRGGQWLQERYCVEPACALSE